MFHILGRFTFISSCSRRSSSGLSKGSNGFGFCFCESSPLSIFVISHQSIHYSHLKPRRWLLARPIAAPIRVPFPGDVPHYSYGSVLAPIICSRSEEISVAFPASVRSRLLAGGVSLCDRSPFVQSRRRDHFWGNPENTNLLGLSDWVRRAIEIIRGKRSEHPQCGGPVVSVSCSIATVTRRQIAAPA